ncbi:hypothetical protein FJU31_18510 [Stenotrophomonas cyclobalanopsidis]|uniref:Fap amyloid fibril minor component n=1 Tax=Stenotrophomonas cyclobalanopsidis TaxID=2771362 RepID=A0ABQ6SWM7_9GAMM|nr:hypothetical protein [Stenotrophomonas cyclobalanopsidis]KAA8993443.1 hypothetical protein FJU31_18510 [Stenotrophomonas cyclobalanopsidis]
MNRAARGALLLVLAAAPALAWADDYSGMLSYLDVARIGDRALVGASGAIMVNQASGDLNIQANLQGMATGDQANVAIAARQQHHADVVLSGPLQASAHIEGQALNGASGIASINQASGIANTTLNVVSATRARQGIRETDDAALAASDIASTGEQGDTGDGVAADIRNVGISASALRGFDGVLQLNQIAGARNDTANVLGMVVQGNP